MKNEKTEENLSLTNTMTKNEWHKPEINEIAEVSETENGTGDTSDASTVDS
jgi:hypothetical protein